MSLNSRQRRQADERRAKEAVYRSDGKGPNPFDEGSRLHRMWQRWQRFYLDMEAQFADMEAVYGPTNAVRRYPQT
jgi:hypothetical protein